MKKLPLLLVLPFLGLTLVASGVRAQEKPKTPKSGILVLSLMRVIDESQEGKDVLQKLQEEQASKKQELTDKLTKLQERIKVLRDAKPADRTPEYYKDLENAMQDSARIEMEKNIFSAKKQDEVNRRMQQILILAQQIARDVMRERGAEIVLLTKTGPIELASDDDVKQEFMMRRVLCCDDSLDISDEVLKRMNDWYKENKSAQGVPERANGEKKENAAKEAPKGAQMKKGEEKGGN